jgi:hypothetical protein
MTMADIWLTEAARDALQRLPRAQAVAVNAAISDIPSKPGRQLNVPGAPPAERFLAAEPHGRDAPIVIYRRTAPDEQGDWLVVSLMSRDDYRAARHAEETLAAAPPIVRQIVSAAVAGTVGTVSVTAPAGAVNTTEPAGAATTIVQGEPRKSW